MIGKPTLDKLGFVSDKYHIELQAEGVRFPTLLPEDVCGKDVTALRLVDNVSLETIPGVTTARMLSVAVDGPVRSGRWVRAGPDAPPEIEVVDNYNKYR